MSGPVGFVGRQRELRVLEESLAAAGAGRPQVVYIEADAGAGKSTLLARFLVSVTGGVVLEVCADEAETLLSYGIIDQLQPDVPTDPGADPMIVGQRLVDLLDRLQADGQVVVLVIDDLQWIDRPSSRALLFALRRLRADTVLTVVATRAEGLIDPGWARFVAGDSRVTRIRLEGLTADDLIEMASALELGVLSSRGAARLLAHTGGNPLYSRALLQEIGVAALNATDGGGLPAPRDLSAVILTRVAALSSEAQTFLAAASVLGQHAPIATTAAVAGLSDNMRGSDEAVSAGLLVESPPSELTFAHPLYRAAIYADLSPTNRRRLHALAAEVVEGRAGLAHRVAATLGVDDVLANELESTAAISNADGDTVAAAWALEHAAALSSVGEERERRLLDAAVAHLGAADTDGAARVLASCQVTSARRDALLGLLGVYTGSPNTEERLVAAWSAHNPDSEPSIGARAATSLANWMVISGRPEEGVIWAERAVTGTVPDSALWAMARTAHAYSLGMAGQVAEGLTVLDFLPPSANDVPRTEIDALIMRGMLKVYVDDLSECHCRSGCRRRSAPFRSPCDLPRSLSVSSERGSLPSGRLGYGLDVRPARHLAGPGCRPSPGSGSGARTICPGSRRSRSVDCRSRAGRCCSRGHGSVSCGAGRGDLCGGRCRSRFGPRRPRRHPGGHRTGPGHQSPRSRRPSRRLQLAVERDRRTHRLGPSR